MTKLDDLRGKLYLKAKTEPAFRFYALYDKLHRIDVLQEAFQQSKAKQGAAGVDGQTFAQIEAYGEERWLQELQQELKDKTYQPRPVRRVLIPKPGGGERPLGIPTLRDRVAQKAAVLILEPIFEADFSDAAYGYRPGRSAVEAAEEVRRLLKEGRTEVVDADLAAYFDTIPHAELMTCLARRIADGAVLHLIKLWLKVPVEERDEDGRPRSGGGKSATRGVPQGGVISPLLANLYIHRFLRGFERSARMAQCGAKVINYADDFVVVCRKNAAEVLEQVEAWMTTLKLTLNPNKTSVKDAKKEAFVFLGYELGPQRYFGSRLWFPGMQPSKKAVGQVRAKVSRLLTRGRSEPWEVIREELNAVLRGWMGYYGHGSSGRRYQQMDRQVWERVKNLLRRRHRLPRRTARFSYAEVHQELGVLELFRTWKSYALR